jgi:hypothetical protein
VCSAAAPAVFGRHSRRVQRVIPRSIAAYGAEGDARSPTWRVTPFSIAVDTAGARAAMTSRHIMNSQG